MSQARKLRDLLAGNDPVIAPGCYDGLTALLVEQAGFGCTYLSGASISFTRLGRPDIGLTTMTEVANVISNIRERIDIPIIVDGDTGFGNALNTQRTVRLFERMGAAAIQLEDQTLPKRCGHLEGKTLVSVSEMLGKIRAAQDARQDPDTVIIARTDAIAVAGLDEALERGAAYIEAGADVLFVESPLDDEQLATVGSTLG
ncbi:MAG: isocitrate lyase/PEP mutase family protein, partial [Gammaproteobacteria bacterium]|nr:isocitrate lyase/PEP mutase family protein [Gammaproteobacteria bacterium]